ncbi:hypothetical protein J6590_010074 [Homalodisca vitripennis]|nr:hypothetical protein J6590_010074 [Homalodisca vitripennis]
MVGSQLCTLLLQKALQLRRIEWHLYYSKRYNLSVFQNSWLVDHLTSKELLNGEYLHHINKNSSQLSSAFLCNSEEKSYCWVIRALNVQLGNVFRSYIEIIHTPLALEVIRPQIAYNVLCWSFRSQQALRNNSSEVLVVIFNLLPTNGKGSGHAIKLQPEVTSDFDRKCLRPNKNIRAEIRNCFDPTGTREYTKVQQLTDSTNCLLQEGGDEGGDVIFTASQDYLASDLDSLSLHRGEQVIVLETTGVEVDTANMGVHINTGSRTQLELGSRACAGSILEEVFNLKFSSIHLDRELACNDHIDQQLAHLLTERLSYGRHTVWALDNREMKQTVVTWQRIYEVFQCKGGE